VRVRLVLAAGLALVLGTLVLDMSGSAPRMAGFDHINQVRFLSPINPGGELCQPFMEFPGEAASMRMLVGSYGKPLPELTARLTGAGGAPLAVGRLAAGAHEGEISITMSKRVSGTAKGTLCIHAGPGSKIVLAGDTLPAGPVSIRVNGVPAEGRIAVAYFRPGSESWWQLLPTLSRRFGYGKASFLGVWTLAFAALLLAGVWVATVRLLLREAR